MATEREFHTPARATHAGSTAFDGAEPLPSLLGPSLLTRLATDDDRTVHTAGYGLFVLARTHESAARPIAADLAGRLVRDDGDRAVRRTLASLRLADDDAVREALLDATTGARARRFPTPATSRARSSRSTKGTWFMPVSTPETSSTPRTNSATASSRCSTTSAC